MLGSDVTTSASSPRSVIAERTAWCLRLSAVLVACDMSGLEPLLESGDDARPAWFGRRDGRHVERFIRQRNWLLGCRLDGCLIDGLDGWRIDPLGERRLDRFDRLDDGQVDRRADR